MCCVVCVCVWHVWEDNICQFLLKPSLHSIPVPFPCLPFPIKAFDPAFKSRSDCPALPTYFKIQLNHLRLNSEEVVQTKEGGG